MKDCGESVLRIVEDILDFSKLGAKNVRVSVESFGLLDVVESAVVLHSDQASCKGLELRFCANPPTLPTMALGDPPRVRQVRFACARLACTFMELTSPIFATSRFCQIF